MWFQLPDCGPETQRWAKTITAPFVAAAHHPVEIETVGEAFLAGRRCDESNRTRRGFDVVERLREFAYEGCVPTVLAVAHGQDEQVAFAR